MDTWIVEDEVGGRFSVWTRGNVGEVFPDVVSPLTWSVAGKAADLGWQDAFVEFGALGRDDYDADHPSVVGVFGGYCYLSVSCVRLFAARMPIVKVADIDRSLFGEQEAPPWVAPPGTRKLGRSFAGLRSLLKTVGATDAPAVAVDARDTDAWLAGLKPVADATEDELLARLREFAPRFRHLFHRHIYVSFQCSVAVSLVGQLVGDESLVPALVAGLGDVESAGPSRALWDLGRMVAADPALTAAFDAGLDGIDARVTPGFRDSFGGFLARFGYRGPNEWDFAAQTWDANPAGALAAIDSLRRADADHAPAQQGARLERERADAIAAATARVSRLNKGRFRKALAASAMFSRNREAAKSTIIRAVHAGRVASRELARRAAERGGPAELDRFFLLECSEIAGYLADPASFTAQLADRAARRDELAALIPPFVFDTTQPPSSTWAARAEVRPKVTAGTTLTGIGACPGVAKGRARVVLDPFDPRGLGPGDVLIAPITDPSWTPLFLPAEAVVVDVGAAMSHAVIVSRELGIPAVVSVTGATATIPDGALVEVDGTAGTVRILDVPG